MLEKKYFKNIENSESKNTKGKHLFSISFVPMACMFMMGGGGGAVL
jgi:hypothetical protein